MAPRRMLVTGGSGFLGSRVVPLAAAAGWTVSAPSSAEMDVTDPAAVASAVRAARPTAVVHLAYRMDSAATIVAGSSTVARAAAAAGARLVHVSTDVVFHGRPAPYTERDNPDPLSDYGRMKLGAETAVAAAAPGAVIVRTSLLYGTATLAPCQRDVLRALAEPSTTAFFVDELRCFTHVDDVAAALVRLADLTGVGGPLHVAAPGAVDRHSFAVRTAGWLGRDDTPLRSTTLAAAGLRRPANVTLDSSRARSLGLVCRSLEQGLDAPPPPTPTA